MSATHVDPIAGRAQFSADKVPVAARNIIVAIAAFSFLALIWAAWAQVDELSRAQGRVIPSGKTQIVQSAENGVVTEILVRAGERVSAGQLLIRLDDTTIASTAGEVGARVTALEAQVARLGMEYRGQQDQPFDCPASVAEAAPSVCENEANLLSVRAQGLERGKEVLIQRVEQRQRELNEVRSNRERLATSLGLAQENFDLISPLAERGLVAQTEFIAAQRELNDLEGQIAAADEATARLEAALAEARLQIDQADLQFREAALTEMTERLAELAGAQEQLRGAADRVSRTDIRSPVDGVINSIEVNTIGAVVAAGSRLLDIVPVSETLLVEARLRPSDIAFVLPGQRANIKLTAYDFTVFGGLEGEVVNVSADSIVDPDTRETYFLVLVSADSTTLEYRDESLPILPGMVTNVEILTGKKTVLQYLLKPINKARDEALRER